MCINIAATAKITRIKDASHEFSHSRSKKSLQIRNAWSLDTR